MIIRTFYMDNVNGILILVTLSLLIALCGMDNLTILILSVYEHGIAFYLCHLRFVLLMSYSFKYTSLHFLG